MTLILSFIGFFTAMSFALRVGYVKGRQAGRDEVYGQLVRDQLSERDARNALQNQAEKKGLFGLFNKPKEIDVDLDTD